MATAYIDYVDIEQNSWEGQLKGIGIYVGFEVQGLREQDGQLGAYFYYWQDGPIRAVGNKYRTTDGDAAVSENFLSPYDNTVFDDFYLFMPYTALYLSPGVYDLMLQIVVWDNSRIVPYELATSSWYPFRYSK